jgi:hypothetical protein
VTDEPKIVSVPDVDDIGVRVLHVYADDGDRIIVEDGYAESVSLDYDQAVLVHEAIGRWLAGERLVHRYKAMIADLIALRRTGTASGPLEASLAAMREAVWNHIPEPIKPRIQAWRDRVLEVGEK